MKLKFSFIYLLLIVTSCKNERKELLLADREALLGWVYLKMYDDESFEFISQGMMRDKDVYTGNYEFNNDTLYFKYNDSVPKAGSKAVIDNDFVSYINGSYPESLKVKRNKFKLKK